MCDSEARHQHFADQVLPLETWRVQLTAQPDMTHYSIPLLQHAGRSMHCATAAEFETFMEDLVVDDERPSDDDFRPDSDGGAAGGRCAALRCAVFRQPSPGCVLSDAATGDICVQEGGSSATVQPSLLCSRFTFVMVLGCAAWVLAATSWSLSRAMMTSASGRRMRRACSPALAAGKLV